MNSLNIFIIFGVTGDLTNRKIFPAINALRKRNELPKNTFVIGCGRGDKKANTFKNLDEKISKNSEYIKVDTSNLDDFKTLKKKLDSLKSKSKADKINLISYLSTPPQSYEDIIINLNICL